MPKAKKSGLSLRTVGVQFPRPNQNAAFAPVKEAVSADGFQYCIFCEGKNPTETRPGVLRCSQHANECIDPDCRVPSRRRKYKQKTRLSFTDASGNELLCDHCRGVFFRDLAGRDDYDYERTGIRREFFVYRYTDTDDTKYGMTYSPTRRREQRAGGVTAGEVEEMPLSDFDCEAKFRKRVRTMDWLSPSFKHRHEAYQLECMIKHFVKLAWDRGLDKCHPNRGMARVWADRVLSTSGFAPLERATIKFDLELSRADAPLDPHPETTLTLKATVRATGRANLEPRAFTAQIEKISGEWLGHQVVEVDDGWPSTARQVVGGRAETSYDWNSSAGEGKWPAAVLEFAGDELAIQDPRLEVPMEGGPGWISNLEWLPLRLALRVHSSISSRLNIQSSPSEAVLEPDNELAGVILEWANTETGSRVKDFGESALAVRLLDGFGAFPATRMIALTHALDGRRGRYTGKGVRKQDSVVAAHAAAWYYRAKRLGDPIASVMEARQYDVLERYPTFDQAEREYGIPCVELPTTKAARERAEKLAYGTLSSPGPRFRIVIESRSYTSESERESKLVKGTKRATQRHIAVRKNA